MEAILFVCLAVVPLLPLLGAGRRSTRTVIVRAMGVACLAGVVAWGWDVTRDARRLADARDEASAPLASRDGFVSSEACRSCHPEQYATWHSTFHRTMTQVATPDSVLAPFDGELHDATGHRYRLERRADEFWVQTAKGDQRVAMVTGSHHQQVYWMQSGSGRALDLLPFNYLLGEKEWVPGEAVFLMPPGTWRPAQTGLWNGNCVTCHSVAGEPRLAESGPGADTRVAELGIACEACHGPGLAHVEARRNPLPRYMKHLERKADPTIVNPARLPADAASQVCGQCHSVFVFKSSAVWRREGPQYRAGGDLEADRFLIRPWERPDSGDRRIPRPPPEFLQAHFWPDGTVRVSGREYSGLSASQCHQRGDLSCLTCHTMHGGEADGQMKREKTGDFACSPCHGDILGSTASHTHHAADSSGSRCYNCHMPYTSFGLLKAIRSHRIDSPSVSDTGRPNACNLCHLDRTLAWTSRYLSEWYGLPTAEAATDDASVAASLAWLLRGDAGQRALVAWAMGWEPARAASGSSWMAPFLAETLDDSYAAVRFNAWRALRRSPGYADVHYDYVAPAEARERMKAEALAIATRELAGVTPRSELLIEPDGRLDVAVVEALRRRRDDRPVELRE